MALLNKLFSTSPKMPTKHQDYVCEKTLSLDAEKVRLVLFCECDFRGRRLLFDSHAVDKIALRDSDGNPISSSTGSMNGLTDVSKKMTKYTEISDGHGYICTKPNADIYQLGEMIFGSVAMSYRGTTYKIHHLDAPVRIMCTQVFPSPRCSHRFVRQRNDKTGKSSSAETALSNTSCGRSMTDAATSATPSSTLEHSVRLLRQHTDGSDDRAEHEKEEDTDSAFSGGSFAASSSSHGHSPALSTASDTLLVCRSIPLNLTQLTSDCDHRHSTSDSGLTNSYTGFNGNACAQSMPLNLNLANPYVTTFSNGSLYRRWLRSASMSLDHSSSSLSGGDIQGAKPVQHRRSSKLGLAIIISSQIGQEEELERFLMEHATLVETMVWRARVAIEAAYRRRRNFVARLYSTAASAARWLSDLLIYGTRNVGGGGCSTPPPQHLSVYRSNNIGGLAFEGLSRLWRTDWDFMRHRGGSPGGHSGGHSSPGTVNKSSNMTPSEAERCIRDLCELLETIDVKDTNFFVSTFITAILTHHLGWVTTVLPAAADEQNTFVHPRNPVNPLWGQLTDLYGAIGCPTKIAHTIITGSSNPTSANNPSRSCGNQSDIITKLLNSVVYFIRCSNIKRNCVSRGDIKAENKTAENICEMAECIPVENYKTYVDHLQEMKLSNVNGSSGNKNAFGCRKSFSCLSALDKTACDKNASYSDINNAINTSDNVLSKPRTNTKSADIENVFCEKKETTDVVFVLGDSDELVGLKCRNANVAEASDEDTYPFKDSDFSCANNSDLKKSQSQTDLSVLGTVNCTRAQSVPPELPNKDSKKIDTDKNTPKYKYSGVKFNFQQYPQIVANYMRSKNIELSNLQFFEKAQLAPSVFAAYDFTKYEVEDDFELDTLQTPSNATDLEFSTDQDDVIASGHKEIKTDSASDNACINTVNNGLTCKSNVSCCNSLKVEMDDKKENKICLNHATAVPSRLKTVELPMPMSIEVPNDSLYAIPIGFTRTLLQSTVRDHYIADLVLQGTSAPRAHWESTLRQDLATAIQYPLLDQQIDEAIAIIANIDSWEVQLMSSHTYLVEKGTNGLTIGMSQLVANMLESLLHMWKLQTPAEYCLMHIEQKLQEFCIRSKALAELLLATEFCSMEILTSALQLEVNDIPLLMSIASTHSPHIMQKYGLSFQ